MLNYNAEKKFNLSEMTYFDSETDCKTILFGISLLCPWYCVVGIVVGKVYNPRCVI